MEGYYLWQRAKYRMQTGLEPYDEERLTKLYLAIPLY